jgi:Mn2+/Fe2+ NRAMP family transporter
MGVSFLVSMFMVLPSPAAIVAGFIPSIPQTEGGTLLVAAFVGTTMAGPTFIVRPLLMKSKSWGKENMKDQSRDALVAATFLFVISGSIMITSMGALFYNGLTIERVIDMVQTLEPVAGKFSVALFMVGALSAGISSVFPILMVAPLLIADYKDGSLDTSSKLFKRLTAVACVIGLSIPIMGANPIVAQIASQVANVFILPLIIFGIFFLINSKKRMGEHTAGIGLNILLFLSFVFACLISWLGFSALLQFV